MAETNRPSQKWFERAKAVMPGPHSNARVPLELAPTYLTRTAGAHLWDVDGREYIDYMIGAGPGILGHSNPEVRQAVREQMERIYYITSGALQTPLEVKLAEKMVEYIPCAQKVRFMLAGSEAVQMAIRLARGITCRRYFIRFEGAYHGWMDNVLGGLVHADPAAAPFPYEDAADPLGTAGRDAAAFEQGFRLPYNDIAVLERVLEKWGRQVAMILVEPIQAAACIAPRPGYLERVRALCDRYGIVLCFDEIVTGFRLGLGGAQAMLGVTPDLATYGKALGAGVPIAAVAGRADILDQLKSGRVIGAGTFNGYPLGAAAALAALEVLARDEGAFYRRIDAIQQRLVDGLQACLQKHGHTAVIQGVRGVFVIHFGIEKEACSVRDLSPNGKTLSDRLRSLLADEGILIMWGGRWYLNSALTDGDLDRTLKAADRVLADLDG